MSLVRIVGMYGDAHAVPMVQDQTVTVKSYPASQTITLDVSDGSLITMNAGFCLTIGGGFVRHFGALLLTDGSSLLLAGGTDRIQLQGLVK